MLEVGRLLNTEIIVATIYHCLEFTLFDQCSKITVLPLLKYNGEECNSVNLELFNPLTFKKSDIYIQRS